jgi:hypothetical protein
MQIFANHAEMVPGGEGLFVLCGLFVILPLAILFIYIALTRNSYRASLAALFVSGVPYLILLLIVSHYEPSDNRLIKSDQDTGRFALEFYRKLIVPAGLVLLWVVIVQLALFLLRFLRNGRLIPHTDCESDSSDPPREIKENECELNAVERMLLHCLWCLFDSSWFLLVSKMFLRCLLYFAFFFVLPLLLLALLKSAFVP